MFSLPHFIFLLASLVLLSVSALSSAIWEKRTNFTLRLVLCIAYINTYMRNCNSLIMVKVVITINEWIMNYIGPFSKRMNRRKTAQNNAHCTQAHLSVECVLHMGEISSDQPPIIFISGIIARRYASDCCVNDAKADTFRGYTMHSVLRTTSNTATAKKKHR